MSHHAKLETEDELSDPNFTIHGLNASQRGPYFDFYEPPQHVGLAFYELAHMSMPNESSKALEKKPA